VFHELAHISAMSRGIFDHREHEQIATQFAARAMSRFASTISTPD
jgi:hypothetical protein